MPSHPLLAESHRFSMFFFLSSGCCSSLKVEGRGRGRQTGGRLGSREWRRSSQRETTMYGVEMDVKCWQDLSQCECDEMCKEQNYVRTLSCAVLRKR